MRSILEPMGEKDQQVIDLDVQSVTRALEDAGVEIYRHVGEEIQVAERVRLHIMDSGIRIVLEEGVRVRFTARSQQSDFPNALPDDLFAKVRGSIGEQANPRGYAETSATTVEVKDPVDEARILDTWHEVTYEKDSAIDDLVDEVQWILKLDKYVAP